MATTRGDRKRIVIIGVGGFGRETAFLIEEINRYRPAWELLGFLDDDKEKQGKVLNGYQVLGCTDWCLSHPDIDAVCAIGDPHARKKIAQRLEKAGICFPTLIHPDVVNYPANTLGEGGIVHPGNIINVDVRIGRHVCFEMGSTIGHDVLIEDFVSIMPGVNVAGNVLVGEGSYLGTGCSIIQGKRIGEWSIVGAGAVVIDDVPPCATVVGVPAKVIKVHGSFQHRALFHLI